MFYQQGSAGARRQHGLRIRLWTALLFGLAVLLAFGVPVGVAAASSRPAANVPAGLAQASISQGNPSARLGERYLGRWNYDQPDPATGNNVAVLACRDGGTSCSQNPQLPLPLSIPQVGWIDFSPGPNGSLYGHTDQGCTWNFAVKPGGLELSSTNQLCFNSTIGQYYSIKQWSVQVAGDVEYEQIISQSIQPNGDVLYTTMNFGTRGRPSRHKVAGDGDKSAANKFVGSFTYDPYSFQNLDNITVTDKGSAAPEVGVVHIDRIDGNKIVAHTPDGCNWALGVQGNTAELLDPATQSCQVGSNTVSLRYWAIVTDDGKRLSAFRSGYTFENGLTNNYTFISSLTGE
ncbi:hypothetical protein AB0M47_18000 [Hamadaea sp. NPDC051192]|uniref:hypothetical protein n=1 Tax=Hamadaea sp. NPDC051192 TaxID=3154940 RepID=UPI00341EFAFC